MTIPADYRQMKGRPLELLDSVPQAVGVNNTEVSLKEVYGLVYHSLVQCPSSARRLWRAVRRD